MGSESDSNAILQETLGCPLPPSLLALLQFREKSMRGMPVFPPGSAWPGSFKEATISKIYGISNSGTIHYAAESATESVFDHYYEDEECVPWGTLHVGDYGDGPLYCYCLGERAGQIWMYNEAVGDRFWDEDTSEAGLQFVADANDWAWHLINKPKDANREQEYREALQQRQFDATLASTPWTKKTWKSGDSIHNHDLLRIENIIQCNLPIDWALLLSTENGGQPIHPVCNFPGMSAKTGETPYPLRVLRFFQWEFDDRGGGRLGPYTRLIMSGPGRPLAVCSHNCVLQVIITGADRGRVALCNWEDWGRNYISGSGLIIADSIGDLINSLSPFNHSDWSRGR